MAALQTLRNKPALLMSVIGGALLLFIITMVMENNNGLFGVSDKAGEAFGKEIKINDLETQIAEEQNLQEVANFISGIYQSGNWNYERLTEQQKMQIRQSVWDNYVNHCAIEREADKLGLIVTDADVKAALQNPNEYMEAQFIMMASQVFGFNASIDGYKQFMNGGAEKVAQENPELAEVVGNVKRACLYIEGKLKSSVLEHKYLALFRNSFTTNPIAAKMAFDESNTMVNVAVTAIPYATIADDQVKVTDEEIQARYEEFKENFFTPNETRAVKVLDVVVDASDKDRLTLMNEVRALEDTLRKATTPKEVSAIVGGSKSTIPFNNVYLKKEAFQEGKLYEVYSKLDSMQAGTTTATINDGQNITTFKLVGRKSTPDSLYVHVLAVKSKDAADSTLTAIKGGASWSDLAKKSGVQDTTLWMPTNYYVERPAEADSSMLTDFGQLSLNQPSVVAFQGGMVVAELLETKSYSDKFNVAVIKCPIEYSDETYSDVLSKLNNFVANHKDAGKFQDAAEKENYRVYNLPAMTTADYSQFVSSLGDGTKEAVRWIFDEAEAGQVSNVYESRDMQDNSHLVVVAVLSVNDGDYLPWDNDEVKDYISAIIRQEKKADKILSTLKNVKSIADMQKIQGAQNDTIQTSLGDYPYGQPRLAGALAKAEKGKFVGGIKGGDAIYGIQIIEKTTGTKTFNAAYEMAKLEGSKLYRFFAQQDMYGRAQMGQYPAAFLMELTNRWGKVKDLRYKF